MDLHPGGACLGGEARAQPLQQLVDVDGFLADRQLSVALAREDQEVLGEPHQGLDLLRRGSECGLHLLGRARAGEREVEFGLQDGERRPQLVTRPIQEVTFGLHRRLETLEHGVERLGQRCGARPAARARRGAVPVRRPRWRRPRDACARPDAGRRLPTPTPRRSTPPRPPHRRSAAGPPAARGPRRDRRACERQPRTTRPGHAEWPIRERAGPRSGPTFRRTPPRERCRARRVSGMGRIASGEAKATTSPDGSTICASASSASTIAPFDDKGSPRSAAVARTAPGKAGPHRSIP